MRCPACDRELTPVTERGVTVDVCRGGCGGIWFDAFELRKFDEPHEPAGSLLQPIEMDPFLKAAAEKRRYCPRCSDVIMMRHFTSMRRKVEIDECPSCGGCWLDAGELQRIRNENEILAAQKEAANPDFSRLDRKALDRMRAEGGTQARRARRICIVLNYVEAQREGS